ncbi:MAG: hypothetical protein Q7S94_10235, partial [Gallionella sp.]|nr:hypothetical protein [Gallionella sp.]
MPDRYKFGKLNEYTTAMIEWYGWEHRYWRIAVMLVVLVLFVFSMSVPMSLAVQSVYAATLLGIALFLRRYTGTLFTLVLVVFSVNQSSRYLYWRMTETLVLDNWVDGTFGIILLLAEIYAWLVLLLGYAQTIWPLKRKPEPMPEDTALWPSVDLYITTYDEPLRVVRPTVLAA